LFSLPRSVRRWACVAAVVPSWCRIFNRLLFRHGRLGHALGPTYPRLTTVAGEPWPLRRRGFSPLFAVTTAGICTPDRSTGPHSPASAQPGRPPTDAADAAPRGIGGWLSPVHFQGHKPRRVSCYAFFKGWLLLSLPPRCLRLMTPFGLTFSQHLGALTSVWVVPLSVRELTPRNPSPKVCGADGFGV
jgi:hypothetical protein